MSDFSKYKQTDRQLQEGEEELMGGERENRGQVSEVVWWCLACLASQVMDQCKMYDNDGLSWFITTSRQPCKPRWPVVYHHGHR